MKRVVLAALLSLALSGGARAQESADDGKKAAVLEEARQHVAKAKVHYDLGEFKEAADEYIVVYRLRPIPALLFNIAQAYRQGGMYEKARQFYKSYLRESPDAKNKAMIEQAIREMDELLTKEKRAKEARPTGVQEATEATLPMPSAPKPQPPAPAQKPAEPPARVAVEQAAPALPPVVAPAAQKPPAPAPASKPPAIAMATPRPTPAPVEATTSTQAPAVEESDPIYKKWWLWTAVGAVALGAGVFAMTSGGNAPPPSHLGTTPVFP